MAADDDPRAELAGLVAELRTNLALRKRSGLAGVPARRTVRSSNTNAQTSTHANTTTSRSTTTSTSTSTTTSASTTLSESAGRLKLVREELGECVRCGLAKGRNSIVFGVGNPDAHLVFVGEAPGADEDAQGEPFVGKAGQLLTKMIEAMGYRREDVYICNVIKCRPPGNRNPEPAEVAACEPFLKGQLAAIRPRMIVTLGKFAAQCLLRDDTPITRLRGNFRTYEGITLMPTLHPAYLLRDPTKKKLAWEDLKAVNAALKRLGFEPPRKPAG